MNDATLLFISLATYTSSKDSIYIISYSKLIFLARVEASRRQGICVIQWAYT